MRGHLLIGLLLVMGLFCQSVFAEDVTLPEGSVGLVIKREKVKSSFFDTFDTSSNQGSLIIKMTHGPNKGSYVRINEDAISKNDMSFSSLHTYYKKNDIPSEVNKSQITRYDVAKFNQDIHGEVLSNQEGEDAQYDSETDSKLDFENPLKVLEASTPESCPECMKLINCKASTENKRLSDQSKDILEAVSPHPQRITKNLSTSTYKKAKRVNNKYGQQLNHDLNPSCRQFMAQDGTIGPIGLKIQDVILSDFDPNTYLKDGNSKNSYSEAFLAPGALPKEICPNFDNMNHLERLNAQIWYWMVLANEESGCDQNLPHGKFYWDKHGRRHVLNNKYGWGLFAGELHPEDRNWRGKMCQGNMKNVDVQVNCAIDTMYKQKLSKGIPILSRTNQYWGPNNRASYQIIPNMNLYEPCGGKN